MNCHKWTEYHMEKHFYLENGSQQRRMFKNIKMMRVWLTDEYKNGQNPVVKELVKVWMWYENHNAAIMMTWSETECIILLKCERKSNNTYAKEHHKFQVFSVQTKTDHQYHNLSHKNPALLIYVYQKSIQIFIFLYENSPVYSSQFVFHDVNVFEKV